MTFEQWLVAKGFDPATLTDGTRAYLRAQFDAEQAPKPDPTPKPKGKGKGGAVQKLRAGMAAEAERVAAVQRIGAKFGSPTIEVNGEPVGLIPYAIAAGWGVNRTELEARRAARPSGPAIATGAGREGGASPAVIEAAIVQAGPPAVRADIEARFDPKVLEAAHTRYKGRISLHRILAEAAYAGGYEGHADVKADPRGVLKAAFSTTAIPGILSNTANKYLLAGFSSVESVWRLIARIESASDFKTMTRYRMTGAKSFQKIGPTGELKHGAFGEESFTNKVETYGGMYAISRQDIRNDDLGALTGVPLAIGVAGAQKLNEVTWTEFMDNAAFFSTGNKNYISGASSALSSTSLAAAEQKLMDQVDADGKPLAVAGAVLAVPTGLKRTAMELMASSSYVAAGGTDLSKIPSANTFEGNFAVGASTYLRNPTIPGYSETAWYLLANPAVIPVIEVAFLDGIDSPTVETAEADFSTLGVQMRGFWDFGAKKQDYRGGAKSKGAA